MQERTTQNGYNFPVIHPIARHFYGDAIRLEAFLSIMITEYDNKIGIDNP